MKALSFSRANQSRLILVALAPALGLLVACSDTKKGPPDDGGDDAVAQVAANKLASDWARSRPEASLETQQSLCIQAHIECDLRLSETIGPSAAESLIVDGCSTGVSSPDLEQVCQSNL